MISVSFHWTFAFYSLYLTLTSITSKYFQGFSYSWLFNFQDAFSLSVFVRQLIYYTTLFFVCQPLFRSFLKIFLNSFQSSLCVISFFIIPHFSSFVKPFSELFWSFISELSSFLLNFSLVRYFLLYHFFALLSSAFRDKFLLLLSFALLNCSAARSLIPKFPALFSFFRALSLTA